MIEEWIDIRVRVGLPVNNEILKIKLVNLILNIIQLKKFNWYKWVKRMEITHYPINLNYLDKKNKNILFLIGFVNIYQIRKF